MADLTLPGYELIEKIASGGMGAIWSARSPAGDLRAIKVIHPGLADDPNFNSMLLREAMVMAQLEHENICRFYTFGKTPRGELYLEMEFVDGVTLSSLIQQSLDQETPLPLDICCQLTQGICVGLGYAHRQVGGLIHRDISPQNVMLSRAGEVKILDFGVAKIARQLGNTNPGTLKGKASYMSPEQLCGEELDHRSDIFSVGVVLWELLTGKRLFKAENSGGAAATMFMVLEGKHKPYPAPSSIRPGLPEGLDRLTMKALSFDRSDRYQDCQALWDALEEWQLQQGSRRSLGGFLEQSVYSIHRGETVLARRPDGQGTQQYGSPRTSPYQETASFASPIQGPAQPSSDLETDLEQAPTIATPVSHTAAAPLRQQTPPYHKAQQRQPSGSNAYGKLNEEEAVLLNLPIKKQAFPQDKTSSPYLGAFTESQPQYSSTIRKAPKTQEPTRWLWGVVVLVLCGAGSLGLLWLYQSSRQRDMTSGKRPPPISPLQEPQAPRTRKTSLSMALPRPRPVDTRRAPDANGGTNDSPDASGAPERDLPFTMRPKPSVPGIDTPPARRRASTRRRRRKRRRRRRRRRRLKKASRRSVVENPATRRDPPQTTPRQRPGPRQKRRCSEDSKWLRVRPMSRLSQLQGIRISLGDKAFRFMGNKAAFCILKSVKSITIAPASASQRKRFWPCSVPIQGKHLVQFALANINGMPTKKCYTAQ